MAKFQLIKTELDRLGSKMLQKFATELINQGHRATGSLINSFRKDILFNPSGYRLAFFCNDYGLALEKKRQAGKYVPIAPLMRWVAQKGIASSNKEARSIAFAISRAIYLEGIPTTGRAGRKPSTLKKKNRVVGKGAFRFSRVGRRTAWISHTAKTNKDLIKESVSKAFKNQINTSITNYIRNTNKAV